MFMYRIDIYRYRHRDLPPTTPSQTTVSNPTSPTYSHLESPHNINDPDCPPLIIVRERGGAQDNHVQWVARADLVPQRPFRSTSFAHGVVTTTNWLNRRGDRVWLRSDQPLEPGKRSCPVVNLDLKKSAEVWIRDVRWIADKKGREGGGCHHRGAGDDGQESEAAGEEGEGVRGRVMGRDGGRERAVRDRGRERGTGEQRGPLTIAGPVYRYQEKEFRMCVAQNAAAGEGAADGILEMVTLDDMERFYEDVPC